MTPWRQAHWLKVGGKQLSWGTSDYVQRAPGQKLKASAEPLGEGSSEAKSCVLGPTLSPVSGPQTGQAKDSVPSWDFSGKLSAGAESPGRALPAAQAWEGERVYQRRGKNTAPATEKAHQPFLPPSLLPLPIAM